MNVAWESSQGELTVGFDVAVGGGSGGEDSSHRTESLALSLSGADAPAPDDLLMFQFIRGEHATGDTLAGDFILDYVIVSYGIDVAIN